MSRVSRKLLALTVSVASVVLVAPGLTSPAEAAGARYVALGDSSSTGAGASGTSLGSCGRNTASYPYLVSQQRPDLALTFVACDGATTDDVITTQAASLTADTTIVTITIGGNDVGFANLIVGCATFYCDAAINDTNNKIKNELPAKLDRTYAVIKSKAPSARVVVLGYPRMFGSKNCWQTGVNSTYLPKLNGVADNLDATISAAVARAGLTYKSAIPSFIGHDVCASVRWENPLYGSSGLAYHPTNAGYRDGYTPLVRRVIG